MDNSLAASWDVEAQAAEGVDARGREPGKAPVPPILGPLVTAARTTSLARLHPFTSLDRFCLSDGREWWTGHGRVAPAFVALVPREGYVVWRGDPYGESVTRVLATTDAEEAAAALADELESWSPPPPRRPET